MHETAFSNPDPEVGFDASAGSIRAGLLRCPNYLRNHPIASTVKAVATSGRCHRRTSSSATPRLFLLCLREGLRRKESAGLGAPVRFAWLRKSRRAPGIDAYKHAENLRNSFRIHWKFIALC